MCAVLNRRVRPGTDKFALREVQHLGKKKLRRRAEMRLEGYSQDLVMFRSKRGDSAWFIRVNRNETPGAVNSNSRIRGARNASPSRSGRLFAG
jgi:hypothetical protein